MLRLLIAALLICALPMAAPAGALGKASCKATRDILSTAIAGRKAGQSAKAIEARLITGEDAVEEKYAATVKPLVNLVFALGRDGLTEKVAKDYEAQCLKYNP